MLNFNLVTIFPEFFKSPLETALLGKAKKNGLVSYNFYNPRDFSSDRHLQTDDRPFGGGPGMIMTLQPILATLEKIPAKGKILLMSPAGKELNGTYAETLAKEENITIICGRYEGIDARLEKFVDFDEIRVSKAILNGGETAALALIESACRFLPGFMGKEQSARDESHAEGLFEYPQYTRPANYAEVMVPEILMSGNHAEIKQWRRKESLRKTLEQEPELLSAASLDSSDINFLSTLSRKRYGRNMSFCLFHYPVKVEKGKPGVSSLTNLDIHDISRVSKSYGLGPFFILTPLQNQLDLLDKILKHWTNGAAAKSNPDRCEALKLATPVCDFDELKEKAFAYYGRMPIFIVTSASWSVKKGEKLLNFNQLRQIVNQQPVIICLGTANGLAYDALPFDYMRLAPIRFLDSNHLSVRGAAAILADRLIGDYY